MKRKPISSNTKSKVWEKTGGRCFYCGRQTIPFGNFGMSFHVDHLWPHSRGGGDNIENLIPSCRKCNTSRGDLDITTWLWEKSEGTGAWGMDHGVDWSEAKKDPRYLTDAEFVGRG